ncbi:MAG: hypothetical protein H6540_00600 [Bacteroidales bacterium]|nr:hypothetical protein [Bacteroidales bacterium]
MLITKRYIFLLTLFLATSLLSSCFKEDEVMFPLPPGEETPYAFEYSIYDYQSYFDFSSDSCTSVAANEDWQIEFGTNPDSWEVKANSGAYYEVYPTKDTAFNGIAKVTNQALYVFDASSGNPDSCSFSRWLDRSVVPAKPTREVFLLSKYDGIKMAPMWKIRIDSVNTIAYFFTYATFPSGTPVQASIQKNSKFSFMQYSLINNAVAEVEPEKSRYDLLFSQYATTLYDNTGTPTPYFVRGILLNPYSVEAALDSLHAFEDIDYDFADSLVFSNRRDVIGHEWKDVKIDIGSNTAQYYVNTKLNWIIRDTEGNLYKMRFKEFYNSRVEVGYTSIDFQLL